MSRAQSLAASGLQPEKSSDLYGTSNWTFPDAIRTQGVLILAAVSVNRSLSVALIAPNFSAGPARAQPASHCLQPEAKRK